VIIYCATNKKDGLIYIGQTTHTLAKRWREHCKESVRVKGSSYDVYFHRAIRVHGADAFVVEEMCRANSQEELDKLERLYIRLFESYPVSLGKGYNMTPGGDGYRATGAARKVSRGYKVSEQGRRNISLGHMGNKSWQGKSHSKESREKISKTLKEREWKPTEKWLAAREAQNGKERPEMRGRKQTPEDREKKRQAAVARWAKVPIEERREILSFNREPKTPEHRRKIAETLRNNQNARKNPGPA
jgi:group I intron endonuclease